MPGTDASSTPIEPDANRDGRTDVLQRAIDDARRQAGARERRSAAYLLGGSMVASTGYAVWFSLWDVEAADRLLLIALAGMMAYAVALALHGAGRGIAAGVISTIGGTLALGGLGLAVGEPAMFHLVLLGVGLAVPVVIPANASGWRVALASIVTAMFVIVVLAPAGVLGSPDPWLSSAEVATATTLNQFGALVNLAMVGLMTYLGFERTRALLVAERTLHRREADTDQLTGLANRRPAQEALRRLSRTWQATYAVALVDMDDFKEINDHQGHDVGDDVIVAVADALTARFRTSDVISRWGGDEFLVILESIDEGDAARVVSRALRDIRALEVPAPDGAVSPSASAGVALARHGDGVDEVLAAADRALYRAKRRGGGQVSVAVDVSAAAAAVSAAP